MQGSVETEDAWNDPPPPLEMPEDEMLTRVKRIARDDEAKARELVALYRKTHPGITNTDVWLIMNADNTRRANAQTLGELKSAQGKAAAYLYYFNWRSPVHKGQMKSYHTLDIPFVLYNIDIAASMTGAGQERYALAHKMSAAWAAFARTGNPNHPDLPKWPAFNARTLSDDDPRERVQGGERSESRGAAGTEIDSRRRDVYGGCVEANAPTPGAGAERSSRQWGSVGENPSVWGSHTPAILPTSNPSP